MVLRPHENHIEWKHSTEKLFMGSFMCVQALCAAVVLPDLLQTMALVFSGADVMCATRDPTFSTPYLLAQRAGQRLQMEFLHQNKLSGKQQWVLFTVAMPVRVSLPAWHYHLADLPLKQLFSDYIQKSTEAVISFRADDWQFSYLKWLFSTRFYQL